MTTPGPSLSTKALFDSLGTTEVLSFVTERRGEDLNLDFKLAPANFGNRDDRKTLATAISGFANSSGGLIVWGIDARKGPSDDVDCAQQAVPLTDPALFLSRLTECAGGATSPPVADVIHRLVEGPGGPFALTYVPESDGGPHMAKNGEDRYYQRSGDRFYRMEHFAIADMFGRRRRPHLELRLTKEAPGSLLVSIVNAGRGAAKAPYLALVLPSNFQPSSYGYDGHGTFGLKRGGWAFGRCDFGGDAGTVIHSGQHVMVTRIEATMVRPDGTAIITGPQTFRYELAAEDLPLEPGEAVVDY